MEVIEGEEFEQLTESDIEGNDLAQTHLATGKKMKMNMLNENQPTILHLINIRNIKPTRSESIRNTHELRKYDALEGVGTGRRVSRN